MTKVTAKVAFPKTSAPAQRAINAAGYKYLSDLHGISLIEFAKLHGIGPKAIRILKAEMKKYGWKFGN